MTLTKPSQDGRDALDFSSSDNGVRIRTVPKLRQTSFVVPSFRFDRFSLACQDCVSIGLLAFAALLAMDDDSASSLSRFLPPPSENPSPRVYLSSTQDLLTLFGLYTAYQRHVLQSYAGLAAPSTIHPPECPPQPEEKKGKNSYRHLVANVPGKHPTKKDDYLTTTIGAPPKSRIQIVEFDSRTLMEAFTVSAEGLKGWNANALILESAQAREDRKKRKELKRVARAQALAQSGISRAAGI